MSRHTILWAAAAGLVLALAGSAQAVTVYWDINDSTAGAGGATPTGTWDAVNTFWNDTADGTGTVAAWSAGDTAVFAAGADATGTYTVTVDGTQDIGGLTFEEGTVTLSGGTALRLTSNATVDVASGKTATVSTVISEDATARTLTTSGAGTLILSGANSYSGATTVSAGTLQLDGTLAAGGTLAIGTAGKLTGSGTASGNATVTGNGVIDFSSTGRIVGTLGVTGGNWNGEGSVGAKITTTSGEFTIPTGATLNVGDLVADNNRSFELQGASTVKVEGTLNIDPETMVAVRDAGTLIVTGTVNTFGRWIPVASNSAGNPTARIILEGSGRWNHTHGAVNNADFVIGESGTVRGELIIRDSAQVNSSFMRVATWGSTTWGVIIQDGGTATFAPTRDEYLSRGEPAIGLGANGQAEYRLNGGVLNSGLIGITWSSATGQGRFYFNGGTLIPNTDDPDSAVAAAVGQTNYMENLTQVIVQAGGAIIDTDGHKITIAQNLEHDGGGPAMDGGLTKRGAGTLILNGPGASTYTGPTVVNEGTLLVNNTTGSGTGTGTVAVNSGATLGGSGTIGGAVNVNNGGTLGGSVTINGAVTVNAGGIVSPGASAGILTLGDVLTFADGGNTWVVELFGTDDRVNVAGALTFGDATVLEFPFSADKPFQPGSYTLASYGSLIGTFSSADLGAYSSGVNYGSGTSDVITLDVLASLLPGDANLDRTTNALDYVVVSNHYNAGTKFAEGDVNGDGAVNALDYVVISNNYGVHVPEPATLALLALGGLGLVLSRKRK